MSVAGRRSEKERLRAAQALADDPGLFSRHALERPLRSYQLAPARAIAASVANGDGLTFTVLFPRQAGKNELSAHLEAFLLHRHRLAGGTLVKAAPTYRPQLVNSLLRLERLLASPFLARLARKRLGYIFELGQASIHLFSAQLAANVVGATASVLLEGDEAQAIPIDKWHRDFRPMAATTAATSVLYGTPWTDDTLLAQQIGENRLAERRDGRRRHFEVSWEEVAAVLPAYGRHVQAEIDRLGQTHPAVRTQYLLQTIGRDGRLLDATQLALLRGDHPPLASPAQRPAAWGPGEYVAGIDVAGADEEDPDTLLTRSNPRRDSTVLAVAYAERSRVDAVVEPRLHVVALYAWRGTPHRQLYPHLLALVRDLWHCRTVVVDATGVGGGLSAFLSAALGPRVVLPYLFTAASKSRLAYDFLAAVNAGRLRLYAPALPGSPAPTLPGSPDLLGDFFAQAAAAEYAVRANQTLAWYVPDRLGHDDLLNAVVLAVQAGPLAAIRAATARPIPDGP